MLHRHLVPGVIAMLFFFGSSANAADLWTLAKDGDLTGVKAAIAAGADVNAKDEWGDTALLAAASFGHSAIVEFLFSHGARIEDKNKLLCAASQGGLTWLVKSMLDKGASLNSNCKLGKTPLRIAAENGRTDTVKFLLKKHPQINKDQMLIDAAAGGLTWLVKSMLDKGVDINTEMGGTTAINMAIMYGHSDTVKFLLSRGAQINNINYTLGIAAGGGLTWLVERLLDQGAEINNEEFGETPLHTAVEFARTDTVKYLLKKGADPSIKDRNGKTPLDIAISADRKEIADILMDYGARINPNLIFDASSNGHIDVIKFLLSHGVDINIKSHYGFTPLFAATRSDEVDTVKFLLSHGADVNAKDYLGKSALDYATNDTIKNIIAQALGKKIQLFHISLITAKRNPFRKAIRHAGAKPLREDNRYWYDKYDSSRLLTGTDIMYAGYVARTGALAIVEYRFPARMDAHKIVEVKDMLASKYGPPSSSFGKPELGKASFAWDRGEVKISIYRDWPDTTVYLDYIVKSAKKEMDSEIAEFKRRQKHKQFKKESNAF